MEEFAEKAAEYFCRVERHIFGGNDIRSDSFMDREEKQAAIKALDKARTLAHDEMIKSFCQNFDYRGIDNRTQLADVVAKMVFTGLNIETNFVLSEGAARDELAEYIHKGKITREDIIRVLEDA